jgi:NAD(P)-dependent dehydrogenase (short-subunit alcohol dehydrogenase family)
MATYFASKAASEALDRSVASVTQPCPSRRREVFAWRVWRSRTRSPWSPGPTGGSAGAWLPSCSAGESRRSTRRPVVPRPSTSPGAVPLGLDITDDASVAEAAAAAPDVTLLINNAGVATLANLVEGAEADIRLAMETNYFGTLRMVRAFAPVLKANGGGAVLNVLSVMALMAYEHSNSYSASKAAAWALTNGIRLELAGQGTQVTGLAMASVDTDMMAWADIDKTDPAEIARCRSSGRAGFSSARRRPPCGVRVGVASAPARPSECHGVLLGGCTDPADREAQRHPPRSAENLIHTLERERRQFRQLRRVHELPLQNGVVHRSKAVCSDAAHRRYVGAQDLAVVAEIGTRTTLPPREDRITVVRVGRPLPRLPGRVRPLQVIHRFQALRRVLRDMCGLFGPPPGFRVRSTGVWCRVRGGR